MSRFLAIAFLSFASMSLVGGCGVFNWLLVGPTETGSAKLIPFSSEKELADYLSGEIQRSNTPQFGFDRATGGIPDAVFSDDNAVAAPSAPSDGAGGSEGSEQVSADSDEFSQTTIQEAGVDEADVVKTDGDYIYVIDDGVLGGSVLRIVAIEAIEAGSALTLVSETALDGYGRHIYLYDDKIIALTSTGGGLIAEPFILEAIAVDVAADPVMGGGRRTGTADSEPGQIVPDDGTTASDDEPVADEDKPDDDVAPPYVFERPKTIVTIVDVSDRSAPAVLSKTAFEGSQSSSRLIDGVLHLIVSNYQSYYYDVFPMLGTTSLDATIADTAAVLPKYTRVAADGTEASGSVVTWDSMYRPEDPDGFGVVTVISLDVDADAAFTSVGVAAEPGLVYSSTAALYLTDTEYNFGGNLRETTDIYKFTYEGRGVTASATGSVPGRVLNQYSMGEYQGNLRVASTISAQWGVFGQSSPSSNNVYVLGQNETTLDVIGSVTGIAPGETIQSARFMGARGYVVTFLQIDPLFTLDLADATNPKIVGELKVPGFSTFIVPMGDDHLLTVGRYVPPPGEFGSSGVQVSIYDITDFSQPTVLANVVLGEDTGANSEAIGNPKAFTYYAERGLVAFPLSVYEDYFVVDEMADVADPEDGATDSGGATDGALPPDSEVDALVGQIEPYVPGGFEGMVVFSATVEDGLSEIGRISTRYLDAERYWSSFTRGVFIGDDCLAVTNNGIRRAAVSDTEATIAELLFE